MRAAALPPLIAFLLALLYLAVYPLLGRVPPLLFWMVVLILFAGTAAGAYAIARAATRRALGWLIPAVAMELLCAWMFLGMVVPWL